MAMPATRLITWSEYLDLQEASDEKLEYHNGFVYNMTGGTFAHALLQSRLIQHLGRQLEGKPCLVLGSEMRIRIELNHTGLYPDLSIVCGPPRLMDDGRTLLNPKVILEVLSPSTAAYDRGAKFSSYALLPDLQEYLLVDHARPQIERRLRQPGGWVSQLAQPGDRLLLASVPAGLDVDALYTDVPLTP